LEEHLSERILITSALLYANGSVHFGHIAGAYLPGDCYARFERLLGNEVLYISGSDEYGIAITLSAELAKREPKEHVDIYHELNQEIFRQLNFSFDHYSRTTWEGHTQTVQEFFKVLLKNGFIEEREENHLYSEEEKRFLADRYVVGICPKCGYENARGDECTKCGSTYEAMDLKSPLSKMTGSPLVLKPSKHWYYRFDLFKERLSHWLEKKQWKSNVMSFTKNYLDDLRPRGITRDSTWGVPIPLKGTEGKVFYVWFDAPIGYISAVKEWAEKVEKNPDLWKKYWLDPSTKLVHFIGKDNIPFHTLFFPAMLMGQTAEYKLPDEVPANEFFTLEGRRFSKSDNWFIDLDDFFNKYTSDQIRYYLAANAPETSDCDFSWKDFQSRCNNELLGKLGNFVNRTLVFAQNHYENKVPKPSLLHEDLQFLEEIKRLVDLAKEAYGSFHLRKASQILIELSSLGNVYFDHHKPWFFVKDLSKKDRASTIIYCCLQCIQNLALIAFPILPTSSEKIWEMLGMKHLLAKELWEKVKENLLSAGQKLGNVQILFRKIEDSTIEEEIKKLKTLPSKESFPAERESISIEDFDKIDLRVGQILKAEPITRSKKLYKLEVDLGFAKRQIVSGIAQKFEAKDLVGKKVLVIVNLKPITLMGVESHGMILVASFEEEMELPTLQNLKPGSSIS
jgi:methionyl-tRNA synthetase